jgi:hypothetical protein
MWTLSQQAQYKQQGVWPNAGYPAFPNVGAIYGGGFIGGKINISGTQYYLIVAPRAFGNVTGYSFGPRGVFTSITNTITGPTNTTSLAALGSTYAAATFCENLTIGAYSDWYLPAKNELEVLYYFLKPGTIPNQTYGTQGQNPNAVSPEPVNQNYTSGSPAQTSVIPFREGNVEAFDSNVTYFTSCDKDVNYALTQNFQNGEQSDGIKDLTGFYIRAVRRVPV